MNLATQETIAIATFLFILGAAIGSFLNVCIVRMPQEKSIVFPGSHCMNCQHPIAWYHNIPIISYLALKGKCPYCQVGFSFRYCAVEFMTGVIFVLMFLYYGLTPVLIPYLFMVCCFIVATFVDFGHRIIPDEISVGGMFAGFLFSCFIPALHHESLDLLSHGRILMQSMLAVIVLYSIFRNFQGGGEGDSSKVMYVVLAFVLIDLVLGFILPSMDQGTNLFAVLRSVDASALGILVGGGLIYLMAVLGDMIIPRSRRKIPKILKADFVQTFQEKKLSAENIEGLWNSMINSGYMTAEGETSDAFWKIKKAEDLKLDPAYAQFKKILYRTVLMDTMGGGDVKLLAMVGAFLGWQFTILTFFIAPFFGAVYGIIEKIRTKDNAIAYGPFLVLGALMCMLKGPEILALVMKLYGLY